MRGKKSASEYEQMRYARDGEKRRTLQREYYARNRAARIASVKKYVSSNRDLVRVWKRTHDRKFRAFVAWLKDQPCADCGNSFPSECMDFDHVRGTKRGTIGMGPKSWSWLAEEVQKCDLICANCHRIRTRGRIQVL